MATDIHERARKLIEVPTHMREISVGKERTDPKAKQYTTAWGGLLRKEWNPGIRNVCRGAWVWVWYRPDETSKNYDSLEEARKAIEA